MRRKLSYDREMADKVAGFMSKMTISEDCKSGTIADLLVRVGFDFMTAWALTNWARAILKKETKR